MEDKTTATQEVGGSPSPSPTGTGTQDSTDVVDRIAMILAGDNRETEKGEEPVETPKEGDKGKEEPEPQRSIG